MKITIQGDFFDCQIHKDTFYVWDTWGGIRSLNFNSVLAETTRDEWNKLELTYSESNIDRYHNSVCRDDTGIFPLDTLVIGNALYTAMENAVYKKSLLPNTKERKISFKSKKVIGVRGLCLATDNLGLLAIAAGNQGVFEVFDNRKIAISKWEHRIKNEEDGFYLVTSKSSRYVEYQERDILSWDFDWNDTLSRFRMSDRQWKDGRIRRSLLATTPINQHALVKYDSSMSVQSDIRTSNNPSRYFIQNQTTGQYDLEIAGKPRCQHKAIFGTVTESRKELVVQLVNGEIIRIEGPITRSRVLSGYGGRNNLLMVVLSDRIVVTNFYDKLTEGGHHKLLEDAKAISIGKRLK